jgi:LytS/YehU family sensor histidine kinase
MLRYVLDSNRAAQEDVALGDELEFVRNFLALEQLRLGDRLRVVENLHPDTLDCVIPSLTLQPLVENAVKYAVASRVQGGTIRISSSLQGSSLMLEVSDDGPGVAAPVEGGSGVGLRAVRQRLENRFPGASSFQVRTAPGEGFAVHLMLPARTGSVTRLMRPKIGAGEPAVAVAGR